MAGGVGVTLKLGFLGPIRQFHSTFFSFPILLMRKVTLMGCTVQQITI